MENNSDIQIKNKPGRPRRFQEYNHLGFEEYEKIYKDNCINEYKERSHKRKKPRELWAKMGRPPKHNLEQYNIKENPNGTFFCANCNSTLKSQPVRHWLIYIKCKLARFEQQSKLK